jgi:hypothetical protein
MSYLIVRHLKSWTWGVSLLFMAAQQYHTWSVTKIFQGSNVSQNKDNQHIKSAYFNDNKAKIHLTERPFYDGQRCMGPGESVCSLDNSKKNRDKWLLPLEEYLPDQNPIEIIQYLAKRWQSPTSYTIRILLILTCTGYVDKIDDEAGREDSYTVQLQNSVRTMVHNTREEMTVGQGYY